MSEKLYRSTFDDPDTYKKIVWQSQQRDLNILTNILNYNTDFSPFIGIHALRRRLAYEILQRLSNIAPAVVNKIRRCKTEHQAKIGTLRRQAQEISVADCRKAAHKYLSSFLHFGQRLLNGSCEADARVDGETLEEEKQRIGMVSWLDAKRDPIEFDPASSGVLYWNSKVYGGQQLDRLIREFRAVACSCGLPKLSLDEVAAAASSRNQLNHYANYQWAACELAQRLSRDLFESLVDILSNRASHILERFADIIAREIGRGVDNNASTPSVNLQSMASTEEAVTSLEASPYMQYLIKDHFLTCAKDLSERFRKSFDDEFLSTKTVYWHFSNESFMKDAVESISCQTSMDNTYKLTVDLTAKLFNEIKKRLCQSAVFKFYRFMLEPLHGSIWIKLQAYVNNLSDGGLLKVFDVATHKSILESHLQKESRKLSDYEDLEQEFYVLAAHLQRLVAQPLR